MVSDEQLEKALNFIRDNAKEYAQAKAKRVYLTEFRKSQKAILMTKAQEEGAKTSAAQERIAYSDPVYLELLEGIREATEREEELRFLVKGAELKIDIWRTRSANQRVERQQYGA